jgi:hypothetical protein
MPERSALKVSLCGKSNSNEVAIKVQGVRVKCVVDSGADITVLHRSWLPECFEEPVGRIRLKSAFGQVIEADVLTLPMALDGSETTEDKHQVQNSALITFAVTPLLDAGLECLLTPGDYELLCRMQDEVRASTSKIDLVSKKIGAAIEEAELSEKVAVKVHSVQTNSNRESHDTIPTIGLENFVEVDRSSDDVVSIKSDSSVVQRPNTRKNPDSDDEVNSRLSGTGIEPRSDILFKQLNSTAMEQSSEAADTDDPEQLESLAVDLPTTTVEKWKKKKKNVAPEYRKRKKAKKEN